MEVREIVETIVREPVLEVRFRLDSDSDDVIRISEFIISEIQDYGYNVLYEEFDLFDYDEDEDDDNNYVDDEDISSEVDEDELISFMNEFFMISGDIPEPEMF
jgi:hypothetical protein